MISGHLKKESIPDGRDFLLSQVGILIENPRRSHSYLKILKSMLRGGSNERNKVPFLTLQPFIILFYKIREPSFHLFLSVTSLNS